MVPPVQEDKERGLQCGEMYNCVLPKESRHHPSLDFLEMVGRKPQAGKRVRRGKEKGVYVERCIFGSSGSWLRANLLQIAPSPNAYPQKGPKFGFSASLTPIWENAPENITTYFQGPSLPGFHVSFCILRNNPRHKHKLTAHLGQILALIKRRLLKYMFAKKVYFTICK